MPENTNITVRGSLKIDNLPDLACFDSFEELLKAIPNFYSVEVPRSITNVTVSNIEPDDTQRNNLWVRQDDAGGFIGLFVFAAGNWQQVSPIPNGIFRMFGDSRDIPPGFLLADASNPNLTGAIAVDLIATWTLDPSSTFYINFHVTFEGF